jgi:hypothetical protein
MNCMKKHIFPQKMYGSNYVKLAFMVFVLWAADIRSKAGNMSHEKERLRKENKGDERDTKSLTWPAVTVFATRTPVERIIPRRIMPVNFYFHHSSQS